MRKNKLTKSGVLLLTSGLLFALTSFNGNSTKNELVISKGDSLSIFQDVLNSIQIVDDSLRLIKSFEKQERDEINRLQIANKEFKKDTSEFNEKLKKLKVTFDTAKNKVGRDSLNLLMSNLKVNLKSIDSSISANESTITELQSTLKKRTEIIKFLNDSRLLSCKKARNYIENYNGPLYIIYKGVKVAAYVSDLNKEVMRFHLYNQKGDCYTQIQSLKNDLDSKATIPLMITNAGMFKRDLTPVGLFKTTAGETKFQLDTVSKHIEDNFHLYPNGVFYIDSLNVPHIQTTKDFYKKHKFDYKNIKLATQSGPMLVINKTIHPKFSQNSVNEKIRSGVGVVNSCKVVFATTIDNESFFNFASMLRDVFGCENALFLDGAISKMYLKGYEQINYSGQFGPMISISEK